MAANSSLARLERMASTGLQSDAPVSAYRAWAVRNNAQHLIDQSTQHRINWCFSALDSVTPFSCNLNGNTIGRLRSDEGPIFWSQEFIHTWVHAQRPVNLDLMVGIYAGVVDSNYHVNCKVDIHPYTSPPGSSNPLYSNVFTSALFTTPASNVIVETQIGVLDYVGKIPDREFGTSANFENTAPFHSLLARARLDLYLQTDTGPDDGNNFALIQVMLREFV